jgi:hypothetical protein
LAKRKQEPVIEADANEEPTPDVPGVGQYAGDVAPETDKSPNTTDPSGSDKAGTSHLGDA